MSNQSSQVVAVKVVALPNWVSGLFTARNVDEAKVLNSINAARARAQLDKSKVKAGTAKHSAKDGVTSFTQSESYTFLSDEMGCVFHAWIEAQSKMIKTYGFMEIESVPRKFTEWLAKHGKAETAVKSEESKTELVNA